MSRPTDEFDLGRLRLESGEGRTLELAIAVDPVELGSERYAVTPSPVPVRLDISRTTREGYALRLRFEATLAGPCMRCLEPAGPSVVVDVREFSAPDPDDGLDSPYIEAGVLELGAWTREALVLALPSVVLCRPDCPGLCPVCGVDLNVAGPDHTHPRDPDPRWAKLSELRLD